MDTGSAINSDSIKKDSSRWVPIALVQPVNNHFCIAARTKQAMW
jgi:hypothetical protein